MKYFLLLSGSILLIAIKTFSQSGDCFSMFVKTGICHGAKPSVIKVTGKKETLLKFLRRADITNNCNYLLTSENDILKEAKQVPCSDNIKDTKLLFEKPEEFIDFYKSVKRNKEGKITSEICIDSDGTISFSIGNENGSIQFSTKGKISISCKSPDGIEHKAEL